MITTILNKNTALDNEPLHIKKGETFKSVYNKFINYNVDVLPVTNSENKLIGIITIQDILRFSNNLLNNPGGKTFSKLERSHMNSEHLMRKPFSVKISISKNKIKDIFVFERIALLPVVDDQNILINTITPIDLLESCI